MHLDIEPYLSAIRARIEPLERLATALSQRLPKPFAYHSGTELVGFRYGKPGIEHFCLLKAVRAVSALNACLELARSGYTQEIGVLIRTIVECTTHIEFVLTDPGSEAGKASEIDKYVQAYFADFGRRSAAEFKRAQVKQRDVHERLGAAMTEVARQRNDAPRDVDWAKLYSNVYLTFSNYVHAKYPETMDLYGGEPAHFHLRGMGGTPKDAENLEIVDTYVTTVALTFRLMALRLRLDDVIEKDPVLSAWKRTL